MKKSLKIRSLREKEVPSALDAVILTAAALHLKRKKRRMIWQLFSAAAAASVLCAVLVGQSYVSPSLPQEETGVPLQIVRQAPASPLPVASVRQSVPLLTTSELLAMGDFTTLEQETFAFDQTSYASGISGDSMM